MPTNPSHALNLLRGHLAYRRNFHKLLDRTERGVRSNCASGILTSALVRDKDDVPTALGLLADNPGRDLYIVRQTNESTCSHKKVIVLPPIKGVSIERVFANSLVTVVIAGLQPRETDAIAVLYETTSLTQGVGYIEGETVTTRFDASEHLYFLGENTMHIPSLLLATMHPTESKLVVLKGEDPLRVEVIDLDPLEGGVLFSTRISIDLPRREPKNLPMRNEDSFHLHAYFFGDMNQVRRSES